MYKAIERRYYWSNMCKINPTMGRSMQWVPNIDLKKKPSTPTLSQQDTMYPKDELGNGLHRVKKNEEGHNNLFGAIDLASSECRIFVTKGRTAATTADCLLYGIFLRDDHCKFIRMQTESS